MSHQGNTLPTLDRAFVRSRRPQAIAFQGVATAVMVDFFTSSFGRTVNLLRLTQRIRSRAPLPMDTPARWRPVPQVLHQQYATQDSYLALAMGSLQVLGKTLDCPALQDFDAEAAFSRCDPTRIIHPKCKPVST